MDKVIHKYVRVFQGTAVWLLTSTTGFAQEVVAPEEVPPDSPVRAAIRFVADLLSFSNVAFADRLTRVIDILLIVLVAVVIMGLIRRVSRFLVYSEWGPLKLVFRNHQRSITLHSLVINLTKYVVYFTALGHILTELGVNYGTVLASLSLVGIAIGFGSQGLVQDVVTGFFILFENQFSVGDMVEIGGQVGVVEEIGLRTTRVRNYLGAEIIFQNRNIPMAARYRRGSMEAFVDVAVGTKDDLERSSALLERIGVEFHRQFEDVIMERPRIEPPIELETGEIFARLYLKLWPGQQWLVDQQVVPRVKELFEKEGVTIPGGRVVAFYHRPVRRSSRRRPANPK